MPSVTEVKRAGPPWTPAVAWVLAIGLTLSAGAAYATAARAERQVTAALATRGELIADAIRSAVDNIASRLVAIGGLYQASVEVTQDEFALFVDNFGPAPGVNALAFAPMLTPGDLGGFVAETRLWYPGYEVFAFNPDLERVPPGERRYHVPVLQVEPDDVIGVPRGLDMTSIVYLEETFTQARARRTVVASPFLPLPYNDDTDGFVLAWPILDPVTSAVDGFAIAVIDLSDFLDARLPSMTGHDVIWEVNDATYGWTAATAAGGAWSTSVRVASRTWHLWVEGGEENLGPSPLLPLAVLVGGLIVTMAAAYGVQQYRQRTRARDELEHLRELARAKDRFLASVSHELRTPLTGVVGFAEMLRESEDLSPEDRRRMVESVADEATDMAAIIDDLLVAARSEIDLLTVSSQDVPLGPLVQSVIRTSGSEVGGAVHVVVSAGENWVVSGDPARIRQVLRNLLTNASRYGGDTIEVRCVERAGLVVIEVADDGEGIPEREWEKIFEPYYRAERSATQPAAIGIGLSVSRHLARLMGGDLRFLRRDGWSVFEFTLPEGSRVPDHALSRAAR